MSLGIRIVSYDRPGYGESDPNPKRTGESEAADISELADQLGLGDSFFVVGVTWGALPAYASLLHIPQR